MATGSNVTSGILVGGELATLLTAGATSLVMKSGQIATRFPAIPTNGYYYLLLIDTNVTAPTDPLDRVEVVKATAISSDTFTIVRGSYEGTTPKQFPITASDPVENVWVRIAHTVEQIKELIHDYLEFDVQLVLPDSPLVGSGRMFAQAASQLLLIANDGLISPAVGGFSFIADADDTIVMTDARFLAGSLSALRTLTLDGTDLRAPGDFTFYNSSSSQSFLLKSGTDYYLLGPHEWVKLMCRINEPSAGAHWVKMDGSQKIRVFTELTQTFTADAGADTISLGTDDGLADAVAGEYDKAFYFSTAGTRPGGLNPDTPYYIKSISAATCQLSLTPGGDTINITNAGSGTHTLTPQWLPPLGVQRVLVEAVGGGGGGASGAADDAANIGNGGGGGGSGEGRRGYVVVTPSTVIAVGIGTGGSGGSGPADGVDGNDGSAGTSTTFSTITASAGGGGNGPEQSYEGGFGYGGIGGSSGSGGQQYIGGGGQGGSGSATGTAATGLGGIGAASMLGGTSRSSPGVGTTGIVPGGGGSGGNGTESTGASAGGDGASGMVRLVY